jgi:hypothetical protein
MRRNSTKLPLTQLRNDIDSALGTPTGAPNFDDQIGPVQELRFSSDELRLAESGQTISKIITCSGDGGEYVLSMF